MTARLTGRRRHASLLLEDLTAWAQQQQRIDGLALVGSYARGHERMASDVDVMLLTTDPTRLAPASGWFQRLRPASRLVRTAAWGPVAEQRYRLRCGLLVEVGVTTPSWAHVPLDAGTRRVLGDGCRVLHDPHHLLARALASLSRRRRGRC